MLNKYRLRKWSRLVRIRDEFICYVCSEKIERRYSQAHHIYPKYLYPEKAYDLSNGVCVCGDCHMPIVHSTNRSWRKFTCFFKRCTKRKKNKEFNSKYHIRV